MEEILRQKIYYKKNSENQKEDGREIQEGSGIKISTQKKVKSHIILFKTS